MSVVSDPVAIQRHSAREQLLALLTEVNALAIRLKRDRPGRIAGETPPTARVILRLLQQHGPLSVPALARVRGTSRQNIQIIVNRLREQGWIAHQSNPAHKRSALVVITDTGARVLNRSVDPETEILNVLETIVSPTELSSACELIRRLRQVLNKQEPTRPQPRRKPRSAVQSAPDRTSEVQAESALPFNLL